jgi:hypothetical protein
MVDPRSGTTVCDPGHAGPAGEERYYWTVTVIGEPDPVSAGRTAETRLMPAGPLASLF